MTVLTAWAIGKVTASRCSPPSPPGTSTAGPAVDHLRLDRRRSSLINVVGVVIRRIAAGSRCTTSRPASAARSPGSTCGLPLAWHHRHPSGQLLSNANADVEATWNVFAPLPMAHRRGHHARRAASCRWCSSTRCMAIIGLTVFPALFLANVVFQRAMSPRVVPRPAAARRGQRGRPRELRGARSSSSRWAARQQESDRFAEVTRRLQAANVEVGPHPRHLRPRHRVDPDARHPRGPRASARTGSPTAPLDAGRRRPGRLPASRCWPSRSAPSAGCSASCPRTVVGWDRVDAVLKARGELEFGAGAARRGAAALATPGSTGSTTPTTSSTSTARTSTFQAIHGVSLEVPAGSHGGRSSGPPGSGKTTLTNLTLRLVDPHHGRVTLDGLDLREVARGGVSRGRGAGAAADLHVRRHRAAATSRSAATTPTSRCGPRSTSPRPTGFVTELPLGIETRVGERGTSLSGGQRQRIALARAVIRGPQLLVLDDATVPSTRRSSRRSSPGCARPAPAPSVLVVAYRMSTITLADQIVYVEGGRVVDHGTHRELSSGAPATSGSSPPTPARRRARRRGGRRGGGRVSTSIDATSSLGTIGTLRARARPVARAAPRPGDHPRARRGHHGRPDRRAVRGPADHRQRAGRQGRPRPRAWSPATCSSR